MTLVEKINILDAEAKLVLCWRGTDFYFIHYVYQLPHTYKKVFLLVTIHLDSTPEFKQFVIQKDQVIGSITMLSNFQVEQLLYTLKH